MSEPISGTQREPIKANPGVVDETLLDERGNQRSSSKPIKGSSPKPYLPFPCMTPSENWPEYEAPSDLHATQSVSISVHQCPSVAISGNQWKSVAISGNQW